MIITLRAYMNRLAAIEKSRPEGARRHVPSMEELAREVGIHPVTLSNIANSNVKQLNLETAGRIIAAMRRAGFNMGVSDLVEFREADEE